MEKIQQAIEKARAQRQSVAAERDGSTGLRSEPRPVQPPSGSPASSDDASDLPEHATKTVRISEQVLKRNRIAAAGTSQASDVFRILRTQLLGRLESVGGNTVAISSPTQGDGKTLIAVNLAVSIARHQHRRALLVDLDFRRPCIARCFGIDADPGLSDYLEGRASLAACLVSPGLERLTLLPQGRSVEHSSELLASPLMRTLATELGRRYADRLVIYDCPPLLVTDDALIALDFAAGCLLVVREGKTTHAELTRAAELVGEKRLLGSVVNAAEWAMASPYTAYGYYGSANT